EIAEDPSPGRGDPTRGLEGPLHPEDRDHRVVAQPLAVDRIDAVREDHDLPPDDRARAEGEVEVVLAIELDAEEGLQRGAVRGEIEEIRRAGGRAALELAPPEEREGDVDAARDVRVHTDVVAAVALAHVVGAEVEPEVQVRLDPAPEEGRR